MITTLAPRLPTAAAPPSQRETYVSEEGERIEVVQRYPDGDSLYFLNGVLTVGRLEEVE